MRRAVTVNPFTPVTTRPGKDSPSFELGTCAFIYEDWEINARRDHNQRNPSEPIPMTQRVPPEIVADFMEENGFKLLSHSELVETGQRIRSQAKTEVFMGLIGMAIIGGICGLLGLWIGWLGWLLAVFWVIGGLLYWGRTLSAILGGDRVSSFHGGLVVFLTVICAAVPYLTYTMVKTTGIVFFGN